MRPSDFRGAWREDSDALAVYAESAGVGRIMPAAVAVPVDVEDVIALVRWAAASRTNLVPRGSGSSMSGAAIGPGVVVDLSGLNEVGSVDTAWERVWCGPGATRARVERAANAAGLRFPVDPSSGAFCTIGGMAATNAAGARSLGFGAMRRWVRALDCVFADGSRAVVRRGSPPDQRVPALQRLARADSLRTEAARITWPATRKNASGYALRDYAETGDVVDLLVGSEGTLALFVGVELQLAALPAAEGTTLATWPDLDAAAHGAALAREAGAVACELLDRTFLDFASRGARISVPAGSEAVLLVTLEGDADGLGPRAEALERAFRAAGATEVLVALDTESAEALWSLRHAASPVLARLDPDLKSMQLIEDGCVPPDRLADYIRGVRAALDRTGFRGVLFGHAGDAHLHANVLVDVRAADWRERASRLFDEVVELTGSLGGVLTGEHGDGRLRTPVLSRVWPEPALELIAALKRIFDPEGILNPGVKVPVAGQQPLREIKYDPALPPLPENARRVLALVEEERAYDRPRLELLDAVRARSVR
ncbi:MAG TPA: FAD-binding oxidoreductase [Gemmatimonadaceae bacterium]